MADCWIWIGAIDELGYGRVGHQIMGEAKAHRFAYRLFKGEIPPGMHVLHSCDIRCCVNPEHLRLGTQVDNMADMVARHRRRGGDISGERNGMAQLTWNQVKAIRRLKTEGRISQAEIARRFAVSPMTVSRIVRRQSWA